MDRRSAYMSSSPTSRNKRVQPSEEPDHLMSVIWSVELDILTGSGSWPGLLEEHPELANPQRLGEALSRLHTLLLELYDEREEKKAQSAEEPAVKARTSRERCRRVKDIVQYYRSQ